MKLYFDTRGGKFAYITIYCDDELFGHILIPSFKIYMVEIPDGVKTLKISSTAKKFKFEGLRYDEIQDLELCFEKEPVSFVDFELRQWQYPYEAVIQLDGSNKDLLIYQTTFPQNELDGALGFRARILSDGRQMETTYIKRKKSFHVKEFRWFVLLILLLLFVYAIVDFQNAVKKASDGGMYSSADFYMYIMIIILNPVLFSATIKYKDMLKESKLKSEYYLDSDGNWSSSEK